MTACLRPALLFQASVVLRLGWHGCRQLLFNTRSVNTPYVHSPPTAASALSRCFRSPHAHQGPGLPSDEFDHVCEQGKRALHIARPARGARGDETALQLLVFEPWRRTHARPQLLTRRPATTDPKAERGAPARDQSLAGSLACSLTDGRAAIASSSARRPWRSSASRYQSTHLSRWYRSKLLIRTCTIWRAHA
jgi:hypothetical protein